MSRIESSLLRSLLLFLFTLVSFSFSVHAQQPTTDGPPVIPSPHKIYVDTADNKLFWPYDMPFWVRLTASPDPNAPSYLLQRVAPESDITTDQYNKQGIALEIQGKQFIRWYNYVTKQTVNLMFFTDGAPPVTRATCSGAETAVVASTTFYGRGLQCSLAAQDELSGVENTYFSLNDQPYQPYSSTLALNKQQPVVLRYYAVDHVGFAEKPLALRFTVDLTPPTTTDAITGNALGTVLSSQAKFRITSTDALSGVATIHARFDAQDYKLITEDELAPSDLTDGPHTLSYYAVDRVGNREAAHDVQFYLDRVAPTVEAKVLNDLWLSPSGTRFISSRSKVELTSQDNKSGVAKIEYAFEPSKYQLYSSPFLMPNHAGSAKVMYQATDKLGNTSPPATLPYVMDTVPPQSTYNIVGPKYQVRSDIYITSATRIELSSTDDASGVEQLLYQVEGAPEAQPYTTPLSYPEEGRRLVRYWSTDHVENRELDRALVLITDNTPPQIFANFSIAPVLASNANGVAEYRRLTSLFLGATDNAAGVHKIYYSFDGGKESEYSTPLVLDHAGTFDLLIRVDDNLGNQSTKRIRFVIRG